MLRGGRGTIFEAALGRVRIDFCGEIDNAKGARDAYRGDHPPLWSTHILYRPPLWSTHTLYHPPLWLTHILYRPPLWSTHILYHPPLWSTHILYHPPLWFTHILYPLALSSSATMIFACLYQLPHPPLTHPRILSNTPSRPPSHTPSNTLAYSLTHPRTHTHTRPPSLTPGDSRGVCGTRRRARALGAAAGDPPSPPTH